MKRLSIALSFTLLVSGLALLLQTAARADAGACGEKGQPKCPLQGWMEKNMQDPIDAKDFKTVAASLEKVTKFVPDPKWNDGANGWSKLAGEGVKAAKAGDLKATKAACKSCHKAWRKEYKKQYRHRPIPG